MFDPVIDHCVAKAPSTAAFVKDAAAIYQKNLSFAARDYLLFIGSDADERATPQDVREVMRPLKKMHKYVKTLEPTQYCSNFAIRLLELTPEVMLEKLKDGYAVRVKAAQKPSGSSRDGITPTPAYQDSEAE